MARAGKEISSVTNLVSDIAGSTHLLGLNAAIQAAHAGEHGRGFMVVAEEIRKMSEKTKEATKTTSKQLDEVQERIVKLSEELSQMSGAIQNLTENIVAINEMIYSYEKEVAVAVSRLEEKMQTLFK
ncbi:MAG: methyl-accepting chemotaxis protein [Desulfotomaculales bacterium]